MYYNSALSPAQSNKREKWIRGWNYKAVIRQITGRWKVVERFLLRETWRMWRGAHIQAKCRLLTRVLSRVPGGWGCVSLGHWCLLIRPCNIWTPCLLTVEPTIPSSFFKHIPWKQVRVTQKVFLWVLFQPLVKLFLFYFIFLLLF